MQAGFGTLDATRAPSAGPPGPAARLPARRRRPPRGAPGLTRGLSPTPAARAVLHDAAQTPRPSRRGAPGLTRGLSPTLAARTILPDAAQAPRRAPCNGRTRTPRAGG